jgi:hypothetical protein
LHELGRLPDLRLGTLDSSGLCGGSLALGATRPDELGESDVVVCQHSSISGLDVRLLSKFRSIVIDCRHPSGYAGSRSPTATELNDVTSNYSRQDTVAPNELSSLAWWTKIAEGVSLGDINRLLIDKPNVDDSLQYLRGLSNRQFLEVVALRAGILFGTQAFVSPVYSIGKTILAWARHRIKSFPGSGSKFQQVNTLFTALVTPFYCYIESGKKLDVVLWEVQQCKMSSGQHMAYDRACRQVRSSLSRLHSVDENDPFAAIAAALLRLRRHCTHSDIGGALRAANLRNSSPMSGVGVPLRNAYPLISHRANGFNASQPNCEVARHILAESSKLRHLVSILVHDSGCDIVGDDSIKSMVSAVAKPTPSRSQSKTREAKDTKKVVILAVLPEIQVLVSVLLNSIGIDHEVLLRPAVSSSDFSSPTIDSKMDAVAWAHCQLTLSKFNGGGVACRSDVNIVIASPVSAAGDHGGLGVEQADTVICLDEDWSGRGELFMLALISRCQRKTEADGKSGFRALRLVAANTCEETFLASGNDASSRNSSAHGDKWDGWAGPVHAFGAFVAPEPETAKMVKVCWQSRMPCGNIFTFPGCNLFRKRNEDLDEIICATNPLPQLLSSADKLRFLPVFDNENDIVIEMMILRRLVEDEESASNSGCQAKFLATSTTVSYVPMLPPLLFEFSNTIIKRPDRPFAVSLSLLDRVRENAAIQEFSVAAMGSLLVLPKIPGVLVGGVPVNETGDLVERGVRSLSTKNPTEVASSVLFYSQIDNGDRDKPPTVAVGNMSSCSTTSMVRRVNMYSCKFSSSQPGFVLHDGNQGSEALVYFPPIFPRMQECADIAKGDVESLRSRLSASDGQIVDSGVGAKQSGESLVAHAEQKPSSIDVHRVITEDEASHSDAASVLMDLCDDYGLAGMGAVPLPRDSALTAANCSHEPANATLFASTAQNDWLASTPLCDIEEFQAAVQLDPAGQNAGSMILFVSRKRPRGSAGQPGTSQLSRGLTSGTGGWNGVSAVSASAFYPDFNGLDKKGKRPSSASAFDRIPIMDTAQPARSVTQHFQRSKDDYRHRLLSTLRQSGMGATMFEAPIFRVAAVRVRNKVSDRLIRHGWTSGVAFETGPGLPLIIAKQHTSSTAGYRGMFDVDPNLWTSIVKRLQNKDSTAGGEAIELSLAQHATLRRSIVAPCRVDFGPFQCGFLSSPSGMTAAALPRPRVGVSLPMGVKITHATKEQVPLQWNGDDDRKLQSSAVRFGMNWILAARILSGFQDVEICSQAESNNFLPQRAARSCRDRWQRIVRSNPSLATQVRQSERFSRSDQVPAGGDPGRRGGMPQGKGKVADDSRRAIEFLLPPLVDNRPPDSQEKVSDQADANVSAAQVETITDVGTQEVHQLQKARRTFSAFKLANAKKQVVPISIPGVTSGTPSAIGPSHPSHDQAVHTSVSASWTGGRTDMWPLQLLDAADRQRTAAAAATAATSTIITTGQGASSSSRTHTNGASTSNRGQLGNASQSQRSTTSSAVVPPPSHRPQVTYPPVPPSNSGLSHSVGDSPNQGTSASSAKQSFAPPQAPHATAASSSTKVVNAAVKVVPPLQPQQASSPDDRGRPGQPQAKN